MNTKELSEVRNKAINKEERLWWLASAIVLGVFGAFFTWMVMSLVDIRDGVMNFLVSLLVCLGSSYWMGAAVYGSHRLHPMLRLQGFWDIFEAIPVIGLIIKYALLLGIAIVAGGLAGTCFYWPKATGRIAHHQVLLTDEEIDALEDQGLL